MVLAIFLQGVAIGDNFKILLLAATKPLLIVALNEGLFVYKFICILVLISLFVVWTRAQRQAITGGAFTQFMHSLPMSERLKHQNKTNQGQAFNNVYIWTRSLFDNNIM